MSADRDRDLAEAIYAEITSDPTVAEALDAWHHGFVEPPNESRRMRLVLGIAAANALDTVLARRQREAASTGPWEGADARHPYRPNKKYPWFCADCGYPEHERLQHLTGPWEGGHHCQEEDGYPGSLLPPKREPR